MSSLLSSGLCIKAYPGCWEGQELEGLEGSKEATEARPESGKRRRAMDGNIFEVEWALGLLNGFGWGDKAKVLIQYECQASGLSHHGVVPCTGIRKKQLRKEAKG